MKLHFIRHAESTANINRIVAGQTDSPLSDVGLSQAEELSTRLPKFDLVISSPLMRAIKTAEIATSGKYAKEIVTLDNLMERHWGELEGTGFDYILELRNNDKEEYDKYRKQKKVETNESFLLRVEKAFNEIVKIAVDQKSVSTLVFTHGGFMRMLSKIHRLEKIYPENTSILSLEPNKDTWVQVTV